MVSQQSWKATESDIASPKCKHHIDALQLTDLLNCGPSISNHIDNHNRKSGFCISILDVIHILTPVALPCLTIEAVMQVMPTQDSFDPMLYLAIMHGDTTLSDLKTGRQNLSFEVSERTGQLKDLVSQQ